MSQRFFCYNCGQPVPIESDRCPNCGIDLISGYPLNQGKDSSLSKWIYPQEDEKTKLAFSASSTITASTASSNLAGTWTSLTAAIYDLNQRKAPKEIIKPVEEEKERVSVFRNNLVKDLSSAWKAYNEKSFEDAAKEGVTLSKTTEKESERVIRVSTMLYEINQVNTQFSYLIPGQKLFSEDFAISRRLSKPCIREEDFIAAIGAISRLFEVDTTPIKKILTDVDPGFKIIKLMKLWNEQYNDSSIPNGVFEIWENIILLRNKTEGIHASDPACIDCLRFFNFEFPVTDWENLYEIVLRRLHESVLEIQKYLKKSISLKQSSTKN